MQQVRTGGAEVEALVKNNIRNFIFSSSAAVYGMPKYLPIDENHALKPINFSPKSIRRTGSPPDNNSVDFAAGIQY